jgi:hypothetical protein
MPMIMRRTPRDQQAVQNLLERQPDQVVSPEGADIGRNFLTMNPIAILLAISVATIVTVPLWGEPYNGKSAADDDFRTED